MATYTTSDFKPGLKFMQDGEPCVIVENEFVKPGKGQAFTRTRIRKLISGKVLDVNFKSGTSVEAAELWILTSLIHTKMMHSGTSCTQKHLNNTLLMQKQWVMLKNGY